MQKICSLSYIHLARQENPRESFIHMEDIPSSPDTPLPMYFNANLGMFIGVLRISDGSPDTPISFTVLCFKVVPPSCSKEFQHSPTPGVTGQFAKSTK